MTSLIASTRCCPIWPRSSRGLTSCSLHPCVLDAIKRSNFTYGVLARSYFTTLISSGDAHAASKIRSKRNFATSRQKRAAENAAKAAKPDEKNEKNGAQSRLMGKRPGETPFSPPANPTIHTQLNKESEFTALSNFGTGAMRSSSKHIDKEKEQKTPLILPPNAIKIQHDDLVRPLFLEQNDAEENELRKLFLKQGIVPPPPRPNVNESTPASAFAGEGFAIDPPDPSGVSKADPEDILDLSSMYDPSIHLPDKPNFASPENRMKYEAGTPLTDELIAYIGVRGPITVAEFMRRVLRDGRYGYYTSKGSRSGKKEGGVAASSDLKNDSDDDNDWDLDDDEIGEGNGDAVGGEHVIGSGGDFITAPEVSQLFGESVLVWLMTQYQTMGSPSKIQLIEIGPGKGTLMCDMLRSAIATFPDFASALTSTGGEGKRVDVGVHLVEVTNGMRARQKESLQNLERESTIVEKKFRFKYPIENDDYSSEKKQNSEPEGESNESKYQTIAIQWHDILSSIPTHDDATGEPIPTFVVCQELIDALPIHCFQKTESGAWRERLVDVAIRDDSEAAAEANNIRAAATRRYTDAVENRSASSPGYMGKNAKIPRLRFVLPPDTTPALRTLLQVDRKGFPTDIGNPNHKSTLNALPTGSIIEACPEGLVLVQDIADRLEKCNGAALIIDYGGDGSSGGDTMRGFWRHSQVHPLSRPGEVDVTADVDFGALREAVNKRITLEESLEKKTAGSRITQKQIAGTECGTSKSKGIKVEAFGPITQGKFLASMGVVERVTKKIEDDSTTDDEALELYSAMERLMASDQMGERYKVLSIAPKKDDLFPPPGF
ncbi:hypothetical protein ACHAXS_009940 [Conticribra weissflogii]